MAKKTVTKRALTEIELRKIGKSYYQLVHLLYKISNSNFLTSPAEKEVNSFYRNITKARGSFSIARATNFKFDSFI